jgi:hypothetical protein
MKSIGPILGVFLGCGAVCQGCSEAYGNLVIENRSSREIIVKYPHSSDFSKPIPAHSVTTAFTNVQISGRPLYADVFDANTKKLLLKGPGDGEAAFAGRGQVTILYRPKGDDSSRPMTALP